jgi:uncharacterized protein involved in response to NO
MIESILFGMAFLATWPAILVLCILGIWCEHNESRGFAVFWALVAGASAFFYFNVSLESIAISSVGYVCFGIVWSFYRYKRFIVAKVNELLADGYSNRVEQYHPTKMLDTITAWIIIWPFSLIENLCSDIINGIEALVKGVFKGVYNRIYEHAIADVIRKDEGVR